MDENVPLMRVLVTIVFLLFCPFDVKFIRGSLTPFVLKWLSRHYSAERLTVLPVLKWLLEKKNVQKKEKIYINLHSPALRILHKKGILRCCACGYKPY